MVQMSVMDNLVRTYLFLPPDNVYDNIAEQTVMEYVAGIFEDALSKEIAANTARIQLVELHPIIDDEAQQQWEQSSSSSSSFTDGSSSSQFVVSIKFNHVWTCRILLRQNVLEESKHIATEYGKNLPGKEQSKIATCNRRFECIADRDPSYSKNFTIILSQLGSTYDSHYKFDPVKKTFSGLLQEDNV